MYVEMKKEKSYFGCKSNKRNVEYVKKKKRVNDKSSNKEKKP